MASKKKYRKTPLRAVLSFSAGLALPVCLALGWHAAYGQQDAHTPPPPKTGQTQQAGLPEQPGAKPVQTASARPAETPASRQPERPAVTASQELAALEPVFARMVRKPTLDRLDRTIKMWSKSPKVVGILEERRKRLLELSPHYYDFVRRDVAALMEKAGKRFEGSQFFIYVDRNPSAQYVLVGLHDNAAGDIHFLGADLISSGNIEKGGDYFETPSGVFENNVENFSYRAQGTPNQDGWRGLGAKDSRVWDFGDQRGIKKYKNASTVSQMRLLMHSTDPDKGEPRLGRIDSKGCIRISNGLNAFLDAYSILDRNYEEWARTKADSWLLKKDRTPSAFAGKYLVIGDSSLTMQARNTK